MADSGRDADVIASGREPRERGPRPAGPAWLLAGLLAVALVWATGLAGPDGTADLTGYAWTGAVADRYWMALDPAPGQPRGLRGQFAQGRAAPFASGQEPCAR